MDILAEILCLGRQLIADCRIIHRRQSLHDPDRVVTKMDGIKTQNVEGRTADHQKVR